jgi:hypothetical protein
MKTVTATQARQNWFRLLDEVIAGEELVIERRGRRLVLRAEEAAPTEVPVYSDVLAAADLDHADQWHWEWPGPDQDLRITAGGRP